MSVSLITRQAYSEVDEFLELLPEKERNIVPEKLRNFFKKEKDRYYQKGIMLNIPIKEQNLKEETLAIIALLNLQYWCKDDEEKKKLRKIYSDNEKIYQENIKVKFNSNEIFKKKEVSKNAISVIQNKESIIKRFINIIKNIIKK